MTQRGQINFLLATNNGDGYEQESIKNKAVYSLVGSIELLVLVSATSRNSQSVYTQ